MGKMEKTRTFSAGEQWLKNDALHIYGPVIYWWPLATVVYS